MSDSFRDDAEWRADYAAALRELEQDLDGHPAPIPCTDVLCLRVVSPPPPRRPCLTPFNVSTERVVLDDLGESDLEDPVRGRQLIRARTVIKKGTNPFVRTVAYMGLPVGQVAKSPYQAFVWLASHDRRQPYGSAIDAAVALVAAHIRGEA